MKRHAPSNLAALFLSAMLLAAPAVEGQGSPTETAMEIGFEVFRVAELQVTPIDLGSILINEESGTVTLDRSGGLSYSGGIVSVMDGPFGAPRPGTLTMDADVGVTATIELSSSVDLGGGLVFTPRMESSSVPMTGSPVTVSVYGTLRIPPNTPTGSYGGILAVDVSYN
ncbi:MAG: DUF4402 domain-containing protein [Holophagales bacterium]|nr:DUF4402 domain-containing protein [Holophagales bacterium]